MEGDCYGGGDFCGGGDFGYQAGGFESLGGAGPGFVDSSSGFCGYESGVPDVLQGGEMAGGDDVGAIESNYDPVDISTFDSGEGNLDVMEMQTKMMKKSLKEQEKFLKYMDKQQKAHYKKQMDDLKKAEEKVEKLKKKAEEAKVKEQQAKAKAKPKPKKDDDSICISKETFARWRAERNAKEAAQKRAVQAKQMQQQRYMQAQQQIAMNRAALAQQQAMMCNQMFYGW